MPSASSFDINDSVTSPTPYKRANSVHDIQSMETQEAPRSRFFRMVECSKTDYHTSIGTELRSQSNTDLLADEASGPPAVEIIVRDARRLLLPFRHGQRSQEVGCLFATYCGLHTQQRVLPHQTVVLHFARLPNPFPLCPRVQTSAMLPNLKLPDITRG